MYFDDALACIHRIYFMHIFIQATVICVMSHDTFVSGNKSCKTPIKVWRRSKKWVKHVLKDNSTLMKSIIGQRYSTVLWYLEVHCKNYLHGFRILGLLIYYIFYQLHLPLYLSDSLSTEFNSLPNDKRQLIYSIMQKLLNIMSLENILCIATYISTCDLMSS